MYGPEQTIYRDFWVIAITPTTSHTTVRALLDALITSKGVVEPEGTIVKIVITPGGTLLYKHDVVADEFTIASAARKEWQAVQDIDKKITLKNAVACEVELYYG